MFNIENFKKLWSDTPSNWREKAQWRVDNRDWLRISGAITIAFIEKHGTGDEARAEIKELLDCDDNKANDIMKGQADLSLSEICKLIGFEEFARVMNDYVFWLLNKRQQKQIK